MRDEISKAISQTLAPLPPARAPKLAGVLQYEELHVPYTIDIVKKIDAGETNVVCFEMNVFRKKTLWNHRDTLKRIVFSCSTPPLKITRKIEKIDTGPRPYDPGKGNPSYRVFFAPVPPSILR